MSMRAIKIEPDGSVQRVEITGDTIEAQNDSIHGYLGGYFDIVRTARLGSDTVMLVDDEGLLKELPVNPTAMLVSGYPGWLVGTALILGTAPSPDGDVFTDVPERFRLRGEEELRDGRWVHFGSMNEILRRFIFDNRHCKRTAVNLVGQTEYYRQ